MRTSVGMQGRKRRPPKMKRTAAHCTSKQSGLAFLSGTVADSFDRSHLNLTALMRSGTRVVPSAVQFCFQHSINPTAISSVTSQRVVQSMGWHFQMQNCDLGL
jgi:hypothetical protein